jgi:hypothetical protein
MPGDPIDPTSCTISTPSNVPTDFAPVFTARLGFNHGGIKGCQEGDVEGGLLRFAVAAAYKLDFNNFTVVPKHAEVAARYSNVPTPSDVEERDQEILGALNYYFEQHSYMLDARWWRHHPQRRRDRDGPPDPRTGPAGFLTPGIDREAGRILVIGRRGR